MTTRTPPPSPAIPRQKHRHCSAAIRTRCPTPSWWSMYEQLCPGRLDEGAIEEDDMARAAEHPAGSAVKTTAEAAEATAATVAEEQGDKKKKKTTT